MSNICGRCKWPMSSHDDHASCPQCRIAVGECNLDVHDPCSICGGWTSKQWNRLRRSLVDARARASQRGRQHWTAAFPQLEAWILSSSGPASEISSLVSGDDISDRLLASTSSPLVPGPSTIEPIVPIRARPVISTEQTMQSTLGYGTLPYVYGPPYTAPLPSTAPLPYAA